MTPAPAAHDLLVRTCPAAARLPRAGLPLAPTPLEPWEAGSRRLGRPVWLKRDDRLTPTMAGSKPRKLDYLLGQALERGCRSVVSLGGHGSNHLVALAHYARVLGLECWGATFQQPDTPLARRAARAMGHLGMERVAVPNRPLLPLATLGALLRAPRPSYIGPGGSSPLGVVGMVAAGLELAHQVRDGQMPRPGAVYVALGSGGTAAGLALGLALGDLEIPVLAVRVVEPWLFPPLLLERLVRRSARLLTDLGAPPSQARCPVVVDGFLGRGYGWPTREGQEAVDLAGGDGLPLETTYTGKAMAALLSGAGAPGGTEPLLFWMTWGGPCPEGEPGLEPGEDHGRGRPEV